MEFKVEYQIIFNLLYKNKKENYTNFNEIKKYGSSATSMEIAMIFKDVIENHKLVYSKNIEKLSYNINRNTESMKLEITFKLKENLTKKEKQKLIDDIKLFSNVYLEENRIHIFTKNNIMYEVYAYLQ